MLLPLQCHLLSLSTTPALLPFLWLLSMPRLILSSVQLLSHVRLFVTPWMAACQASLSITNSRSSLKLTSIKLVMPSSHLILCRSLFLLPPVPPSIRVFSNQSTLRMRWPKYWSFSFSIIPSKEHPGLISFRMDLLDLLAVHGTLKSLLSQCWLNSNLLLQHTSLCMAYPFKTSQVSFLKHLSHTILSGYVKYIAGPLPASHSHLPWHLHEVPLTVIPLLPVTQLELI